MNLSKFFLTCSCSNPTRDGSCLPAYPDTYRSRFNDVARERKERDASVMRPYGKVHSCLRQGQKAKSPPHPSLILLDLLGSSFQTRAATAAPANERSATIYFDGRRKMHHVLIAQQNLGSNENSVPSIGIHSTHSSSREREASTINNIYTPNRVIQ